MIDRSPRTLEPSVAGLVTALGFLAVHSACAADLDPELARSARPLSPEESMATMRIADGYSIELVAAEPLVEEPVLAVWDGNGRMYVAEMRTYMQEIDGRNQLEPTSRVVRLEDTDGDGRMDKRTVFADNLVLPRMVLPLDDRVVIRETGTLDLFSYRDIDGDGVADEKEPMHIGGGRGGNLEHQPSGLVWNIDNWIYTTYSRHRYRFREGEFIREDLPHGSGQWGITHDDYGRIFYSTAGGENPAMDFQQPIQYGKFELPGEQAPGFREVFPIDNIPDVQGGRGRVRADNTLNHFTGVAGQSIYRGDRMPDDFYGDLILPEPVGRLVRRAKVRMVNGKVVVENAYEGKEFIASTDANFRPLNSATGPDGSLHLVDMYRGIIQEGNWVRPGSYLREVVQQYDLDKNIGRGRIYRIRHRDFTPSTERPRMLEETPAQLVRHLSHPNGWWRDTAQKLIVLKGDQSVVPALKKLAREGVSHQSRIHALWTLEGLGVIDSDLLVACLDDSSPHVQATAIRISEQLVQRGDTGWVKRWAGLLENSPGEVVVQVLLSSGYTNVPEAPAFLEKALRMQPENEAVQGLERVQEARLAAARAEAEKRKEMARREKEFAETYKKGEAVYTTLCFACHGADGKGTPMEGAQPGQTMAPTLIGSERVLGRKERLVRILLHGLEGPVDGRDYTALMVPMASNGDEWIAQALTYIRNSWGNKGDLISAGQVAAIRAASGDRATPWTLAELEEFDPPRLGRKEDWRVTASHNKGDARAAIDGHPGSRYTTGTPMRPGMWYQITLPEPADVFSILLESGRSPGDYPRGYRVFVSDDGKTWDNPVATGEGVNPLTEILFKPVSTRFLRIEQTGAVDGLFWSVHELEIGGRFGERKKVRGSR